MRAACNRTGKADIARDDDDSEHVQGLCYRVSQALEILTDISELVQFRIPCIVLGKCRITCGIQERQAKPRQLLLAF
jgi:hypothetical protein